MMAIQKLRRALVATTPQRRYASESPERPNSSKSHSGTQQRFLLRSHQTRSSTELA